MISDSDTEGSRKVELEVTRRKLGHYLIKGGEVDDRRRKFAHGAIMKVSTKRSSEKDEEG